MIKVVQFGEGNFLRCFADAYFDTLNEEGYNYSVDILTHRRSDFADFTSQNNRYNIVIRGVENGENIEKAREIKVVNSIIAPFKQTQEFFALAKDDELKIIISNTTEAGIVYNSEDDFENIEKMSYPARLTRLLFERFKAKKSGVYILPTELIDNNADRLKECVDAYIKLWNLPDDFKKWNDEQNYYCNTLVDRIVSGYPRDEEAQKRMFELVGWEDKLLCVGEPFGLWAVEKKGEIEKYIIEGKHNIDVVLTDDINCYKKRKVRILNGSHTSIVAMGLMLGKETVYDCMCDEKIALFMENLLKNEIIPFVSSDVVATTEFANSVKSRFLNPYLNHQLISIALNSISKFKARDLESLKDYYEKNGKIPALLTLSLSYLLALYSKVEKKENRYFVYLGEKDYEIRDEKEHLDFFANGGSAADFLKKKEVWGEDLAQYNNLVKTVENNILRINSGEKIYE